MNDQLRLLLIVGIGAVLLYCFCGEGTEQPNPPGPCPGPNCPDTRPDTKPKPRKPWGKEATAPVGAADKCGCCPACKCDHCPCRLVAKRCAAGCHCCAYLIEETLPPTETITVGGPTAPDGQTPVRVDLPVSERIKNIGSKRDGAGLCVMSSVEMSAARWANIEALRGLRDWCAQYPGGGYPAKVDQQLKQYCAGKGIPVPQYVQYEGPDPAILELALKTGRMPAVTYSGQDGVRYKGPIAHMVNLVHFDSKFAAVMDNNAIGADEILWMSPAEFVERWKTKGNGWTVVFLEPGPPPMPRNR